MVSAEEFIDELNSLGAKEDLQQYQDVLKHIMYIVGKHGRIISLATPYGEITLDPLTIRHHAK